MKSDSHNNIFEENLSKMLKSSMKKSGSAFEENLSQAVLAEVHQQRLTANKRLFFKKISFAAAAAVIFIAAVWFTRPGPVGSVGQVRNLYGIVTVGDGRTSENIVEAADIRSGQWIETLSGSKAEIVLSDQSRLLPAPRTVFQVLNGKHGHRILLKQGYMAVQAAKQPSGKSLMIKTNGSRVKILGTTLDVRLVNKPDGSKQTRVSVASGRVELESSGRKVLLPANTEGIADEGKTPVKRPLNLEVSEMVRLFNKNHEMATQSNVNAGLPTIIDFKGGSTAEVWTMVPYEKLEEAQPGQYVLKLKYPAFGATVFTFEGKQLPVHSKGRTLHIDFSEMDLNALQTEPLILKLPEVKGIFQAGEENFVRFDRPSGLHPMVTLFQFRLPELANIEHIYPEPIETAEKLNKLVVTVATNSLMLEVYE